MKLVSLLKNNTRGSILSVQLLGKGKSGCYGIYKEKLFPPHSLLGTDPDISQLDLSNNTGMLSRKNGSSAAADIAANLPASAQG